MVQTKNIRITPVGLVLTGLNNHTKASTGLYRGSSHILSPLDFIEAIQEGAIQQTILFLLSAGSVLRVTSLRPDNSSGKDKGVKVWYAEGQKGCFQLNCRATY